MLLNAMIDDLIVFAAQYLIIGVVLLAGASALLVPARQRHTYLISVGLTVAVATVLIKAAGAIYYDPRPFTLGARALIMHAADNGFPSDHTVLCVCAALLTYETSQRLGIILLVLAATVGAARVAAGAHHPLDILGGIIIGLVSVSVATWSARRLVSPSISQRTGETHLP